MKIYPQVIENIEDWPIYKLHEDRAGFIAEIERFTLDRLMNNSPDQISDIIAKTIYLERIRIKEEPWKVDPPNEKLFWKKIRKRLVNKSLDKEEKEALSQNKEILERIIHRYAEEIVGTFKISTFLFARKFLTAFFNRMLNTAASRNLKRIYSSKYRLYERFKVVGATDEVRSLMKKGVVVVVPTHFSNLDSILVGYAMDAILGLPSFSYGAGLNLYNTGFTAYYMNRLGAYRLDRRKKNPIYLETLKAMSNLSLQRGTNSLFFPGGTRSRSGELETKLKLGLFGTVVEAQRALCERGEDKKIFVVPLIIGYNTVLEAPFLIDQHLQITGKESYHKTKDLGRSFRTVLKFAWKFFSKSSEIYLSFGKPLDVLGNEVDSDGKSRDKYNNILDIKDYFISNDKIKKDLQREREYTIKLGDKLVERYHKDNVVLASHLVAYAAFNILTFQNQKLDLYGVLRLPTDDYVFSIESMKEVVGQLQRIVMNMEKKGDIKVADEVKAPIDKVIIDGVSKLGNYHVLKPLRFNKAGKLVSENFKLLYFYHNRMNTYHLDKKLQWKHVVVHEPEEEVVS